MSRYAAAHPGKMGDALYCLPLLRYLYGQNGWKFDFYTSPYCAPLKELFQYQPYINQFIVADDYVLENMGQGCQPPDVPIHRAYERIYQLGFRKTPDTMLHQFIAREAGVNVPLAISYECPGSLEHSVWQELPFNERGYICIAPRGNSAYNAIFDAIEDTYEVVVVGGQGDYRGYGVDMTGLSMLDTATILSHAQAFIGLMSSQLALANGFPIPRIALGGQYSDMRHAIKTAYNHYPGDTVTVDEILRIV